MSIIWALAILALVALFAGWVWVMDRTREVRRTEYIGATIQWADETLEPMRGELMAEEIENPKPHQAWEDTGLYRVLAPRDWDTGVIMELYVDPVIVEFQERCEAHRTRFEMHWGELVEHYGAWEGVNV